MDYGTLEHGSLPVECCVLADLPQKLSLVPKDYDALHTYIIWALPKAHKVEISLHNYSFRPSLSSSNPPPTKQSHF